MKWFASLVIATVIALGGGPVVLAQDNAEPQVAQAAKININTATADELQQLTGIGAVKANSIVAHRAAKPFSSVDELTDVEGIGQATLERIRAQITVE